MDPIIENTARVILIGVGATAVMDAWLMLLKRLGVPTLNFAFIGRWAGHVVRGQWAHQAIAKAAPVKGELLLGWLTHYGVGVAFAGLLASIYGVGWIHNPTLLPALLIGVATVAAPLLIMQPAMGAGIASSKTATPFKNCLRSVVNHTVFGAGLYAAAAVLAFVWQA